MLLPVPQDVDGGGVGETDRMVAWSEVAGVTGETDRMTEELEIGTKFCSRH